MFCLVTIVQICPHPLYGIKPSMHFSEQGFLCLSGAILVQVQRILHIDPGSFIPYARDITHSHRIAAHVFCRRPQRSSAVEQEVP